MEVWHRVSQQVIVELHGLKHILERAAHRQEFLPVPCRFLISQLSRLGHMASAPDDNTQATLNTRATEIGVADLTRIESYAVVVRIRTSFRTTGAALTAAELVERFRPLHT